MQGVSEVWMQVADKWDEVVAQIGDGDWEKATTCDDWNVRELVDHTMYWQSQGSAVFNADVAEGADWTAVKPALAAALADPANLEGNAEAMGGMPKQGVVGLITTDLLVHAWDLAKSVGADATLPPAAVESALMGLQRLPEEMLRSETMFGAAVEVAEGASAQDKLIAFVGRNP